MKEKRKKIISVLLSAVLCFTLLGTIGINAEDVFEQPEEQPVEEIVEVVEETPAPAAEPAEELPFEEEPAEEPAEELPVEKESAEEPAEELPVEEEPAEELPAEDEELPEEESEEDLELVEEEPEEEQELLGALASSKEDIDDAIKMYFTDSAFRDVVADALWNEQCYSSYSFDTDHVADSLAAFSGEIDAKNKGIYSIEGIQYLKKASEIDFTNNNIRDLTPIENTLATRFSMTLDFRKNPVEIWPTYSTGDTDVSVFTDSSDTFRITDSGAFKTTASYFYGTDVTQTIKYGVTMHGSSVWDSNIIGGVTGIPQVAADSTANGTFVNNVTDGTETINAANNKDGNLHVTARTGWWRYLTNASVGDATNNTHELQASYGYFINSSFYGGVDNNARSIVLGGVKFTKTDSAGKPVAGAKYMLYSDSACTTVAKDYDGADTAEKTTGSDGVVTWDNLANGTYYIKETVTAPGYKLNSTVYTVKVDTSAALSGSVSPVTGGYSNVTINNASDTWTPDWSKWNRNASSTALDDSLKFATTGTHTTDVSAQGLTSGSWVEKSDVFIKNGGNPITLNCGSVDATKVTAKSASIAVNGTNTFTSVADAESYINGFISGDLLTSDNYSFTVDGSVVYQLNADSYNDDAVSTGTDESAPVYLRPTAFKTLVGNPLQANQFKFNISGKDSTGSIDVTKGNKAASDGKATVDFDIFLEFDEAGTFDFELKEVDPGTADDRITPDVVTRYITVTVTESTESGTSRGLKAVVSVDGTDIVTVYSDEMPAVLTDLAETKLCEFKNYCTQPLYIVPTCYKILQGRTLKDGEFGFQLTGNDSTGSIDTTGYNDAFGKVKFLISPLKFTAEGDYSFTLKEVIPGTKEPNMTYDENVYDILIRVSEDSDHQLSADVFVKGTKVAGPIVAKDTTEVDGTALKDIAETKLCTFNNKYTAEARTNPCTGVKG